MQIAGAVALTSAILEDTVMTMDWAKLVADLERLLKLRNPPFGMKLFDRVEDMEAIPRIRKPPEPIGTSATMQRVSTPIR